MIAIPNMEKPKSCDDCMFEGEDWGCTINLDWKLRTMEEVYKACPLIEIPQEDEKAVLFLLRMRKATREGKSWREFLDEERRAE